MIKHFVNMFRHRPLHRSVVPYKVLEQVEKINVDENGVSHSSFVSQDVCVSGDTVPRPSDYRLEDLLAAGVALQPVNCQLLDSPLSADVAASQIDKFIDSHPDKSSDIDNTKSE